MTADDMSNSPDKGDTSRLYKVNPNKEWGNGLGKRTARNSVRTVFLNFREYLSFFVALFLIQSMFWLICFTTSTNIMHQYRVITESYDYDMLIGDLDASEWAHVYNDLELKNYQTIRSYDRYEYDDAKETLKVSIKAGSRAETFISYYLERHGIGSTGPGANNTVITFTPRHDFMENYINITIKNGILAAVFLTALSVVLLMALYNVRINHFKFLYGVYMTCGAGFKKLFSTAKWEMFVISGATLIGSYITTSVTVAVLYHLAGVSEINISWWMAPAVILLNFITVYFAVRTPMKHMSKKAPLSLIVAQDNSNLVSSPRRSFRIFNKKFPWHYELYSTWRFRKYFTGTLVTAVIFTSLFICGVYAAHMNKTDWETAVPAADITVNYWSVDMSGSGDSDFGVDDAVDLMNDVTAGCIESVSGVSYSRWRNSTKATAIVSHITMQKANLSGSSEFVTGINNSDGYSLATNYVDYTAFDRHYIDTICRLYEVEGNPYAVLDDRNKIIISDSVYNTKNFNFKPGDRISAAQFLYYKDKIDEQIYDNISYLMLQLERCAFDYKEYEIAAVIHGKESGENIVVGMNYKEFLSFTGQNDLSRTVEVMLDSSLTQSEADAVLNRIDDNLNDYLGDFGIGYTIHNNYTVLGKQLAAESVSYPSVIAVSIMLLLLSPVVWFFSQVLFYMKREKEISLLHMFGAGEKQLKGVYTFAGLIMSVLAMVTTVILSLVTSYIMFKLFNQILPSFGFTGGTRYDFYLSGIALLVSIAVSVACGFVSSYIPYRIGRRRRGDGKVNQLSEEN